MVFDLGELFCGPDGLACGAIRTNLRGQSDNSNCKQVAIGNYVNLTSTDFVGVKQWYRKQKPHWGNGLLVVFEKYYQLHRDVCDAFINNLEKVIARCEQEIGTTKKVK